jgi:hypothetical protein
MPTSWAWGTPVPVSRSAVANNERDDGKERCTENSSQGTISRRNSRHPHSNTNKNHNSINNNEYNAGCGHDENVNSYDDTGLDFDAIVSEIHDDDDDDDDDGGDDDSNDNSNIIAVLPRTNSFLAETSRDGKKVIDETTAREKVRDESMVDAQARATSTLIHNNTEASDTNLRLHFSRQNKRKRLDTDTIDDNLERNNSNPYSVNDGVKLALTSSGSDLDLYKSFARPQSIGNLLSLCESLIQNNNSTCSLSEHNNINVACNNIDIDGNKKKSDDSSHSEDALRGVLPCQMQVNPVKKRVAV